MNRLPAAESKSFLELCFEVMQDFIMILLIVAAIVSLVLGLTVHDEEDGVSARPHARSHGAKSPQIAVGGWLD